MKSVVMRILRVLAGQGISWGLLQYGNITVPIIGITVGALINGLAKFIRDKYPKSVILEYLPI